MNWVAVREDDGGGELETKYVDLIDMVNESSMTAMSRILWDLP